MAGTPTSSQASAPTWAWSSPYSRCADARGASGSTERDPVAGADRCGGGGGGGWAVAVGAVGSRQQAGSRQAGGRSARCSTHGPLPPCAAPVAIPAPPCMQIIQHLRHYSEPVFQVGWGEGGGGGKKKPWVGGRVGRRVVRVVVSISLPLPKMDANLTTAAAARSIAKPCLALDPFPPPPAPSRPRPRPPPPLCAALHRAHHLHGADVLHLLLPLAAAIQPGHLLEHSARLVRLLPLLPLTPRAPAAPSRL